MLINQDTIAINFDHLLQQLTESIMLGLRFWLNQPFDPGRRFFWLFLLSSALIAVLVTYIERKRSDAHTEKLSVFRSLFNKHYWFNRSTLFDLYMSIVNTLTRFALLIPLLGSHLLFSLWVAQTLLRYFDSPYVPELPWYAIAFLYTITFFVLEDLSRYILHRAMHSSALLWRFHKLHHSATVLTPLTLQRIHPVEMTLYYLRGIFVFGTVSGIFLYLFANDLNTWDVLGVDALGFMFALLGANLRHSHIWLSFGLLEKWFISPAQHQLHHSSALEHQNKNYGTYLSCWDNWSKTLILSGKKKTLNFGLAQKN